MKVSCDLAQDRRAWGASIRDVVNSIGDAGSNRRKLVSYEHTREFHFSKMNKTERSLAGNVLRFTNINSSCVRRWSKKGV